jgi:hypothetical protein
MFQLDLLEGYPNNLWMRRNTMPNKLIENKEQDGETDCGQKTKSQNVDLFQSNSLRSQKPARS